MTNARVGLQEALASVGPRLRRIRRERGATLAALAEVTGISKSTLSRLESGQRRPSLELLLPIARAHQVALDALIAPETGDPRVRPAARQVDGMTVLPLTRHPSSLQAFKVIVPGTRTTPDLKSHEGHEWLYVLAGRLRLVLADRDLVLTAGETAEFDTRPPHWFGSPDGTRSEIISLFGRQGERMHVRAGPGRSHDA